MGSQDNSEVVHCVLLPIKAFDEAKERLAPLMNRQQRSELARALARGVLLAAAPYDIAVVCDDDGVASWAEKLGANVIWAPDKGLNIAVEHGVQVLEGEGYEWITVSHADLPYPDHLTDLPNFTGITLIPDRHGDGTNVIKLPSGAAFRFSYGKGSFARHTDEVNRIGLALSIVHHRQLSIDIDNPEDVSFVESQTRQWGPEGPH